MARRGSCAVAGAKEACEVGRVGCCFGETSAYTDAHRGKRQEEGVDQNKQRESKTLARSYARVVPVSDRNVRAAMSQPGAAGLARLRRSRQSLLLRRFVCLRIFFVDDEVEWL